MTVLERGRALATGPVDDLVGETRTRTRVGIDDPRIAPSTCCARPGSASSADGADLLVEGHERPEQISRLLAGHEIFVHELSAVRPDLESVFGQLTSAPPVETGATSEDGS